MNAQKIVETFEKRKNVTKTTLDDLYDVMIWIEDKTDNINIRTSVDIAFRASEADGYGTDPEWTSEYSKLELAVIHGECELFIIDQYDMSKKCERYMIDYINLSDVQKALKELFEKLESFSTREESASKISAIAKILI